MVRNASKPNVLSAVCPTRKVLDLIADAKRGKIFPEVSLFYLIDGDFHRFLLTFKSRNKSGRFARVAFIAWSTRHFRIEE